jgi:hypothetical protein
MLCYNELRMKVLRMFVAAPWPSRRSPGILRNILFNIIQTQMPFAKKGSFTPFFFVGRNSVRQANESVPLFSSAPKICVRTWKLAGYRKCLFRFLYPGETARLQGVKWI